MRFNRHWQTEGKHAFMGASKYHWINDDIEKLTKRWENQFQSERGTRLHFIAKMLIENKIRQARNGTTFNTYVNDAIGFRMTPEVVLFVSENAFGTADAISFEKGVLRIHDLKTGVHPASQNQIFVYFAFFCIEYNINPYDIEMIGRIYQNDEVIEFIADPKEIKRIMERIKEFDPVIEKMKEVMV